MKTFRPKACGPIVASFLTAMLLGLPAPALASEFFGQKGEVFLGGSSSLNALTWSHDFKEHIGEPRDELTFGLSPSFGIFVTKNFFVGGDLGFDIRLPRTGPTEVADVIDVSSKSNVYNLRVGPRLGYNIDFGRGVSLMPNVGGGYGLQRLMGDTYNSFHVDLKIPFVFQIAPHGAIVVGPEARYASTGDKVDDPTPDTFNLGLTGGLLIWI